MTRHLNPIATAIATTAIAAAAVLAGASMAFAGHAPQAVSKAAPAVTTVQLERVVITGKRLPQGQ